MRSPACIPEWLGYPCESSPAQLPGLKVVLRDQWYPSTLGVHGSVRHNPYVFEPFVPSHMRGQLGLDEVYASANIIVDLLGQLFIRKVCAAITNGNGEVHYVVKGRESNSRLRLGSLSSLPNVLNRSRSPGLVRL